MNEFYYSWVLIFSMFSQHVLILQQTNEIEYVILNKQMKLAKEAEDQL